MVCSLQDVGLSKILVNESTMMTSFQGTFEWAPPELINGGECSEKADIYSLGVILWEIVTAERPYRKQFRAARCVAALFWEGTATQPTFQHFAWTVGAPAMHTPFMAELGGG